MTTIKLKLLSLIKWVIWVAFKRKHEERLELISTISKSLERILLVNQENMVELVKSTQAQNDLILKWLSGTIAPLPSESDPNINNEVKPLNEDDGEWVPVGEVDWDELLPPEFKLAFALENDDN
jgi:hypothetical protein